VVTRLFQVWLWLIVHKAPIGGFLVSTAGVMILYGGGKWWVLALALGTGLVGGGTLPADKQVQAKIQWEKEGVDRRAGG